MPVFTIDMTSALSDSLKQRIRSLLSENRLTEAKFLLERLAVERVNDAEVHEYLARIHTNLGKMEDAITHLREVVRLQPENAGAYKKLGKVLATRKETIEAEDCYRRAIEIQPDDSEAHSKLAATLFGQGRYFENALNHCRIALQIDPNHAEAHNNMGRILHAQGKNEAGIEAIMRAAQLAPNDPVILRTLIFYLNYHSKYDQSTVFDAHRRWGELYPEQAVRLHHRNDHFIPIDVQRRLKIGYVSPDFREHPVAHYIEPILANHNHTAYEIFCFAEMAYVQIAHLKSDPVTERMKTYADHWIDTFGLSDKDLAERIRSDGIDILVDLAGHTANNRLLMFTHKPAPIQVTYLGYPNTTGLSAMDCRITDAWADPEGQEKFYTERLVRLSSGFLCYAPPEDAPEVAQLPASSNGHITFGSFNALQKTTREVIATWSKLLQALPSSRLILKSRSWASGEQDRISHEHFLRLFEKNGITHSRIELIDWQPEYADHLSIYGKIDIALDTFPYNGTTTTCEALWMGVPVVTLAGDRHAGRVGVSLLSRMGLSELIADTPDEYIACALRLADDKHALARLRASLRERMRASPVCDGEAFTHALEETYRNLWRGWCEQTQKYD